MPDQSDPVSPDEWILRRVPYNELNKLIDPDITPPISSTAFRPTKNDNDGVSVFRELFATPDEVANLYMQQNPGKKCYVIRVKAEAILEPGLGITLTPDPIIELPGHALIPELNTERYFTLDKNWCKEVQSKISIPLTIQNIVHWPNI